VSGDLIVLNPDIRNIGDFDVRRVLPSPRCRSVGPFVFFDHFGPVTLPAGKAMDVRPHPHVGLATITYLFDGEITHRDSLGVEQVIQPGAVNWMTAGRGIVHSERTPEAARTRPVSMHGLQIWIGLPDQHEDADPAFYHHPANTLPEWSINGVPVRLIAGSMLGEISPVKVFSPMFYLEARLSPGDDFIVPGGYSERAIYVLQGQVRLDGSDVNAKQMAVLQTNASAHLQSEPGSTIVILGGEPIGRRHLWWNFVASSRERLQAAAERWESGGFESVPGDDEFIPLPAGKPWLKNN
jgi:redox-sensitive bicupin YhaK (pirin superfamily)